MKPTEIEQLILTVILWAAAACFLAGCVAPPAPPPTQYAGIGSEVEARRNQNGDWWICIDTGNDTVVRRVRK